MQFIILTIVAITLFALPAMTPAMAETLDHSHVPVTPNNHVVILAVVVEANGTISNATVERSSGVASLDWIAVDRAHNMKLQPNLVEGVPVRTQKKIAVDVKSPRQEEPAPAAAPTIAFPHVIDI